MAIDGRVRESLRRRLSAARPLVIDGAHDLDGCWALDRCVDASGAPTVVRQVLEDVRSLPEQRATMAVAARMAEHLQRYRWPADLVVSPVPSEDPVVELLARAVAVHLEVPCVPLLRLRSAVWPWRSPDRRAVHRGHDGPGDDDGHDGHDGDTTDGPGVTGRIAVRARLVPAHVLLIDDVVRTGRTLRACGSGLRARGAHAVWAMVAAADVRSEPAATSGHGEPAQDFDDAPNRADVGAERSPGAAAGEPGETGETGAAGGATVSGAAVWDPPHATAPAWPGVRERGEFTDVWWCPPEPTASIDLAEPTDPAEPADPEEPSPAADELRADEVSADEASAEDVCPDEPAADEVSVDERPVDEASVDEASVDELPVDELPVDESPVDEVDAGQVPIEEAPAAGVAPARAHSRPSKRRNRRAHRR